MPAVLDIHQHACRAGERGQFGGAIIRQAGDPQGAQPGELGLLAGRCSRSAAPAAHASF